MLSPWTTFSPVDHQRDSPQCPLQLNLRCPFLKATHSPPPSTYIPPSPPPSTATLTPCYTPPPRATPTASLSRCGMVQPGLSQPVGLPPVLPCQRSSFPAAPLCGFTQVRRRQQRHLGPWAHTIQVANSPHHTSISPIHSVALQNACRTASQFPSLSGVTTLPSTFNKPLSVYSDWAVFQRRRRSSSSSSIFITSSSSGNNSEGWDERWVGVHRCGHNSWRTRPSLLLDMLTSQPRLCLLEFWKQRSTSQ